MTNFSWGILIGFVAFPVAIVISTAIGFLASLLIKWASWKRMQIRRRDEWTEENPYWREAFDAGVKWADEGKPRFTPNLGELRMPKAKDGDR